MTPFVTMRRALSDTNLLGAALGGDSWLAWRILLIAAMGEALTDEERAIFAKLTGREREPGERVARIVVHHRTARRQIESHCDAAGLSRDHGRLFRPAGFRRERRRVVPGSDARAGAGGAQVCRRHHR